MFYDEPYRIGYVFDYYIMFDGIQISKFMLKSLENRKNHSKYIIMDRDLQCHNLIKQRNRTKG